MIAVSPRPILPTDWNRFNIHAARVKQLICDETNAQVVEYKVKASVYRAPRPVSCRALVTAHSVHNEVGMVQF